MSVNVPGLIQSVVAVPVDDVSVLMVVSSVNIQTFLWQISDVLSGTLVEEGLLVVRVSPWSHDGGDSDSPSVSLLVGQGEFSIRGSSNGSGSVIEDEPLLVVPWHVVSDSQSVLVVTDVLVSEQSSVSAHSGLNLELNSVFEWVALWNSNTLGVNSPSLSSVVLVPPPGEVVSVSVCEAVWSQHDVAPVLDVLGSVVESSLPHSVSPWSGDGVTSSNESSGSDLSGDGEVSSVGGSDRSGSSVEDEPLLPLPWGMVLDTQFVLVSSDVGSEVDEEGSVLRHHVSELEWNSISKRWVLVLDNDLVVGGLDEGPSLVGSVVAVPPDDVSHVSVAVAMDIEALSSIVSDVSSGSTIDSDLLLNLSSPLSDDSWSSDVESLASLVGDTEVSSEMSSDGSGS